MGLNLDARAFEFEFMAVYDCKFNVIKVEPR